MISLNYIAKHPLEIAGLILAYLAFVVPIRQYLGQREIEERDKRFNNYHRLIKELVGPDNGVAYMDRQVAVVFELRNYPEYYGVSKRILEGLRQAWMREDGSFQRLITEIDLTVEFINN